MRFARLTIAILALSALSTLGFVLVLRRPSTEVAKSLLLAHRNFTTPRMAVVPRSIRVHLGAGEYAEQKSYTAAQLGYVSPTVAALKALHLVELTEYITPATPQDFTGTEYYETYQWSPFAHTLMVRPTEALTKVDGFTEADEEAVQDPAALGITATPGWRFPIALRELVSITAIEHSPKLLGHFDATFCWRWRPVPAGEPFAVGSDTYDRIPDSFWNDAEPTENARGRKTFFDTDLHAAVARLTRKDGRWAIVFLARLDDLAPSEQDCTGQ